MKAGPGIDLAEIFGVVQPAARGHGGAGVTPETIGNSRLDALNGATTPLVFQKDRLHPSGGAAPAKRDVRRPAASLNMAGQSALDVVTRSTPIAARIVTGWQRLRPGMAP